MHRRVLRILTKLLAIVGLTTVGVRPALAQSDGTGALGDTIIDALQELLRVLFTPIRFIIENYGDPVLRTIVGTPHPNAVFSEPTNNAWPQIYDFYWETMMPLTLSLYGLFLGIVIFLESTSHLFSGYHRSKLKRRSFSGLLGILSWWWIAALSLRFMDAVARFLIPSVSDITLFQTLSFTGMGVLGIVVALSTDFLLFVLVAFIYLARQLALYLFVFLMPLLIVFWIPGVGPFALVSKFMKKLAGFYVPFLFMTVPVALLFRLGELLGTSFGLSAGEFGAWVTGLIIPFLAVVSPFVIFWQAGALFFAADRASRHISTHRARARLAQGQNHFRAARQGGKNFVRGIRDRPAVTASGQYKFNSGDSRAHSSGQQLNKGGSRLRNVFRKSDTNSDSGEDGGGGGGRSASSTTNTDRGERDSQSENEDKQESGRNNRHDNMREPRDRTPNREERDNSPRYIQ